MPSPLPGARRGVPCLDGPDPPGRLVDLRAPGVGLSTRAPPERPDWPVPARGRIPLPCLTADSWGKGGAFRYAPAEEIRPEMLRRPPCDHHAGAGVALPDGGGPAARRGRRQ